VSPHGFGVLLTGSYAPTGLAAFAGPSQGPSAYYMMGMGQMGLFRELGLMLPGGGYYVICMTSHIIF